MLRSFELPAEISGLREFKACSYLIKGRIFDLPHTKSVAYYTDVLVNWWNKHRKPVLDLEAMRTVAWFHDTGYADLFPQGNSAEYQAVMANKGAHMELSAEYVGEFLRRPEVASHFTWEQAERIIYLVRVHDKIEQLRDIDELIFMEADTLGAIDVTRAKPTFNREQANKYLDQDVFGRRWSRFMTARGKSMFVQKIREFEQYFKDLP